MSTRSKRYKDDAWRKLDKLLGRFTRRWEPRKDITVTAHATDRAVELTLYETRSGLQRPYMSTGRRNVGTLRELANCINAACDFVEASNPGWTNAPGHYEPKEASAFEVKRN
jgi:hypothetical protein